MTSAERLRRYAELAVRVGANVQPGQDVVVICLVEHAEIARAVTREAYRAGAEHVVVLYSDLHVRRAAIELGPESEIGWSAPYLLDWFKPLADGEPGGHLADRQPGARALTDLDPALVGRSDPRELSATMTRQHRRAARQLGDRRRAESGLGDAGVRRAGRRAPLGGGGHRDATRRARPGCRLARAHRDACRREPTRSTSVRFDAIRFRGPGTDLTVGLVPAARWRCAAFETARGITHIPNLPTEEVFTSPDWRRAEGHVRSTYPLVTSGTKVTGLESGSRAARSST